MGVNYKLLDAEGKKIDGWTGDACFHRMPSWGGEYRDKYNKPEYSLVYRVNNRMDINPALAYLQLLIDIGFCIKQTPKEILKDGYHMRFSDFQRGEDKKMYISEIGATLTVIRYLDEERKIIGNFLNLVTLCPEMDKWEAFQLAHYVSVAGEYDSGGQENWNHTLLSRMNGVIPYKSWEQVQECILKSPVWTGNTFWKINHTYGKRNNVDCGEPPIRKITTLEELALVDKFYNEQT